MGDIVQVNFSASAGNFASTVDEVKDKIASIAEPVTGLTGSLKELGEVLAGVFVVDKIKDFAEEVAETAVQVKSLSQVSGLSTGTIQTLQFAMEMAGGNAEAAGVMIQRFERSIFEASAGSGEAYKDFERLGISLHELRTASPTELFMKTLDGFKNIADATERSDIQIRLFSRSAQRMGPVLVQGSAGFTKMGEMLDETSAKMNDARVNEMSALYSDALRMRDAWEGLGETLLISVTPALELLMKFLKEVAEDLNHVIMYTQMAVQGFLLFTHLQTLAQTQANAKLIMNQPDEDSAAGGVNNRNNEAQAEEQRKIQMQLLEDKSKLYGEDFANFKANQDLMVASGTETKEQEIAAEIRAMEAMRDLQLTNLQAEIDLNKDNALEYQKLVDEKLIMEEKYQTQLIELQAKQLEAQKEAIDKQTKNWEQGLQTMTSLMDGFIRGALTGTQTIAQAFQKMAQNLVITFIEAITRILLENALLSVAQNQNWPVFEAALKKSLGDWVLVEQQKTAATVTGNSQRAASDTAAAVSSEGAGKAAASATILQDAGESAANVYADVSAIPYVGWLLAPPAAAAAFAAVAAFDSFDKGTDNVPHNMLANIHKGEMIVPADRASELRGNGSASPFSGTGLGGDSHVHFHVNAMDSQDVAAFFNRHGKTLAKSMQNQMRGPLRTMMARS